MVRKPIIAGNWKMYKTVGEAIRLAVEVRSLVVNVNHCEIIITPPFTALKAVADRMEGSNVKLGAQDIAAELEQGTHTGEISGDMLRDVGCAYVIVGHSERRRYNGESDALVNRKIRAALHFGLRPIVCVGETLLEREQGRAGKVVQRQISCSLAELTEVDIVRIIVAYEPVWAIGTGRTAPPEQVQAMHAVVRSSLAASFGQKAAQTVHILYGGSAKPENIAELMRIPDIDGALVGGASLEAANFASIVHYNR